MNWYHRWIFSRPIILFGLGYLCHQRSLNSILILLSLILANYLIGEFGRLNHGINIIKDSITKLASLNKNLELTLVDSESLKKIISPLGIKSIYSRYNYLASLSDKKREFFNKKERPVGVLPIKYFVESSPNNHAQPPFIYRCYASHFTWNIIIANLDISKMTVTQKFLLLHEVGHTVFENISLYAHKYSIFMECLFIAGLTFLGLGFDWKIFICLPFTFIFFLYVFDRAESRAEVHSDIWSLNQFKNITDIITIVKTITTILNMSKTKLSYNEFLGGDLEFREEYNKRQIKNEEIKSRIQSMNLFLKRRKVGAFSKYETEIFSYNLYDLFIIIIYSYIGWSSSNILLWPILIFICCIMIYVMRTYSKLDVIELQFIDTLKKIEQNINEN